MRWPIIPCLSVLAILFPAPSALGDVPPGPNASADFAEFHDVFDERRYFDAFRVAEAQLDVARRHGSKEDRIHAWQHYGLALLRTGNPKEATDALNATLKLIEQEHGKHSLELVRPLVRLAEAHNSRHKPAKANRYLKKAMSIVGRHDEEAVVDAVEFLATSGPFSIWNADLTTQIRRNRELHELAARVLGEKDYRTQLLVIRLARLHVLDGMVKPARELFDQAESATGHLEDPFERGEVLTDLYRTYKRLGMPNSAAAILDKAVEEKISTRGALVLRPARPPFPDYCLDTGYDGVVVLSVSVDATGKVHDASIEEVQVFRGAGRKRFDDPEAHAAFAAAAENSIYRYQYLPKFDNGEAVDVERHWVTVSFKSLLFQYR